MAIEWIPLAFGTAMASIDVSMLSLVKMISTNPKMMKWMFLTTAVYAFQPWLFLTSLNYQTMTIMNLIWDLTSDIFVTLIGLFYFGEKIGPYKIAGVCLSFISILLMSVDDGTIAMNGIGQKNKE